MSIDNRYLKGYVLSRSKHPTKEIEEALSALETLGWVVEEAKGKSSHSWGFVLCPANAGDACRSGIFCRMSVWSTPRNPQRHARELLRKAQGCTQKEEGDDG